MNKMDEYLQNFYNTQDWLQCISHNGGWKVQDKSLAALRATLQLLRNKLPKETSSYLGEQLPPMIREMYYNEHSSNYNLLLNLEGESFFESMEKYLKPRTDIAPEEAVHAVFKTLAHKISKEAISMIKTELPKSISCLWD
ncbi:MAG: DUF2267 domain-containing protein [Alphaproteobacteria bacterium]|nr:DUF2267 domain-containing protein [Alphaproteobacteria bacterium]